MKWIAIAGGWRKTSFQIDEDIRKNIREIVARGDGIVSGGALGVDSIATDEALLLGGQIKIIIPSTLKIFRNHFLNRAKEGVITSIQAEELIAQLEEVKKRGFLVEGKALALDKESYFNRITKIIDSADELIAFHINQTEGTQDTIDKAKKKGIPVKILKSTLE